MEFHPRLKSTLRPRWAFCAALISPQFVGHGTIRGAFAKHLLTQPGRIVGIQVGKWYHPSWVQFHLEYNAVLRIKVNIGKILICRPGWLSYGLSFLCQTLILDKISAEQYWCWDSSVAPQWVPVCHFYLVLPRDDLTLLSQKEFPFILTCFCSSSDLKILNTCTFETFVMQLHCLV